MKKNIGSNVFLAFMLLGIIFAIPSIVYLMTFNTIDGYNGNYYYFINNNNFSISIVGAIIFAVLILCSFLLYFKIIEKSKDLSLRKILFFVLGIGLIFLISLPNTSTDVFYYMGTGRVLEEYGENPFVCTVEDILKENPNDEILKNSGIWKTETAIYGPVWLIICAILNKFCFGSLTLLLYIFKLSALFLHMANCIIIYKVTKKKKMVALYGFNPLVLIECLINVHNDIYIVFFALLAIYFLKNKKNIWMSLVMLAISVGIKYLTLILVPIFVLYHLQDKKFIHKIGYIFIYAVFFIFLICVMYFPFANNILDMVKSISQQQNKTKDSIYLLLLIITNNNVEIVSVLYSIMFFVIAYYYIIICLKLLMRKLKFSDMMNDINILFIILIFGVLTNIGSWYLTWFFMSIYWFKGKNIKTIILVQLLYELTYTYMYLWHSDSYKYAVIVIPTIAVGVLIRTIHLMSKHRLKAKTTC